MTSLDPRSALAWTYHHPLDQLQQLAASGARRVAFTSNAVPAELIAAAGMVPVLLNGLPSDIGACGEWLEPVFEPRIRSIFGFIFNGGLSDFDGLILPRTSEQEYKLYLYLSEVKRQGKAVRFPTPCLYNLLHSRSETSRLYGLARTRELWSELQQMSGVSGQPGALENAIASSNRRRAAMRRLLTLRQGPEPRLSGTEAMELLGAARFMHDDHYVDLATRVFDALEITRPIAGIPVLVKGAPLYRNTLHRELERAGAIVVGEDDWWGERAVGLDIRAEGDPLEAIFEKYYYDEPSPRVFPPEAADAWFVQALTRGARAVVFYIPPDDDVLGWDLPRHIAMARDAGLATLVLRDEANVSDLSVNAKQIIAEFMAGLPPASATDTVS